MTGTAMALLEDPGSKGKAGVGEFEVIEKKSKKRKRYSTSVGEDNSSPAALERHRKRVLLCLSRPSYVLRLGSNNLRLENRRVLRHLLQKLVRQHDWVEASGVLSLFLQGTRKDSCPIATRFKYWASMEILNRIDSDRGISTRIVDNLFDTWMMRIGINLVNKRRRRSGHANEHGFVVRLESILFHLMQGDVEGERHNARSLMQEHEFEGHPLFSMIIGLIFYELWYSSLPEDLRWKDFHQVHSDLSLNFSQSASSRFTYEVRDSEEHNVVLTDDSYTQFQYESETSIMNNKEAFLNADNHFHRELIPVDAEVNLQARNHPQEAQPQGFYANSAGNESSVESDYGFTHSVGNLSAFKNIKPWLLPIRRGNWDLRGAIQDEEFKNAVKYLQVAANATPPVFAALIPLIQLLLIGGREKEALHELEKHGGNSCFPLPFRLKAHILECVDPKNFDALATCYEAILKSDPTCSQSLARLISFHQDGYYGAGSLLNMIALHLDAVFTEYDTWREFALCLLKIYQSEEDRMSICLQGNGSEPQEKYSVRYNRLPKFLTHGKSGKAWRLRCRWWLKRHFNRATFTSEVAAGKLELLTYKAACACHLYSQDSEYVLKAYKCLQQENKKDLFMSLKTHVQNSMGLHSYFLQITK